MSRSFSKNLTSPSSKEAKKRANKRFRQKSKDLDNAPNKLREASNSYERGLHFSSWCEPSFIVWLMNKRGKENTEKLLRKMYSK
jgi:hypothetical protein